MPTQVSEHALPLIPPAGKVLTSSQCDDEIKALQKTHCKALVEFWKSLKNNNPKPDIHWNSMQHDLYKLCCTKNNRSFQQDPQALPSPDHDYVSGVWDKVIIEFDADIQAKLRMSDYASFQLVGIITHGEDVTLVHRYEGEDVYNVSNTDLEVQNSGGPNWYYTSRGYEPDGFGSGAFQRPSLYVIGTVNKDTLEWTPKVVEPTEYFEITETVEAMESLLDHNKLDSWVSMALPAFPSGVETRLHELDLLRSWIQKKSYATNDENLVVAAARVIFQAPIDRLHAQISKLERQLSAHKSLQNRAGLDARLNFHGFELGQTVVHASSGRTGVLTQMDGFNPSVFVAIEGQAFDRWSVTSGANRFECEMRLGEWSPAPNADKDTNDCLSVDHPSL